MSFSSCYLSFFVVKQKTAYEMRISDWSSDVCSSDLKTMYIFRLSLVLGLAGLTAACGQKAETPDSSEMTGSTDNMAMAPAAATPILAKGHGAVTAIDKGAGDRKSTRLNSSH